MIPGRRKEPALIVDCLSNNWFPEEGSREEEAANIRVLAPEIIWIGTHRIDLKPVDKSSKLISSIYHIC